MSSVPLAPPDFHTVPKYTQTLGPVVAQVAEMVGFAPYPEQQLLLDDAFAYDPENPQQLAAFDVGIVCARQQMKTGFLKMLALGWLFVTEEKLIIWSAHEFGTAKSSYSELIELISRDPVLLSKVEFHGGSVPEIWVKDPNGSVTPKSILRFKARTNRGTARGLTGSKVILDEAFNLEPEMVGAMLPTMIAMPRGQVVYASSAGMARSVILRSIRDRGRVGSERMAYTEWLAPREDCDQPTCQHMVGTEGCALDRIHLWRMACPITARKDPVRMQAIRDMRNSPAMTPEMFMREILGWWDEPLGDAPIPESVWNDLADATSEIVSEPVFVLEVSPSRDWACIVGGGLNAEGKMHVEITHKADLTEWDHRPGTAWVPARLKALTKGRPVWIAAGYGAESLVPDLELAGLTVKRVQPRDVVSACGRFYDMAHGGELAHPEQTEMTVAVTAARRKWVGEKSFTWVRPPGVSDITPMYGATLAAWLAAFSGYDLMASIG